MQRAFKHSQHLVRGKHLRHYNMMGGGGGGEGGREVGFFISGMYKNKPETPFS